MLCFPKINIYIHKYLFYQHHLIQYNTNSLSQYFPNIFYLNHTSASIQRLNLDGAFFNMNNLILFTINTYYHYFTHHKFILCPTDIITWSKKELISLKNIECEYISIILSSRFYVRFGLIYILKRGTVRLVLLLDKKTINIGRYMLLPDI